MARFADIKAGYVYITVQDVEYRVYIERAGSGIIPMLLQHTAGSDGRQWRHLLEDEEIIRHFHLIAYDLPYHGKSLPPLAERCWETEYRLTKQWFMSFVVTLAHDLELNRPVFMGCSMGGRLALDHPEEFRAVIGIEAAAHSHGGDERRRYLWHPRVSNEAKAAMMHTLCAPTAPEAYRRETIWCYSQGAPAVFKGDLHYYAVEHDLTDTARNIDTGKVDVYILKGDYDWSGTVAAGQAAGADRDVLLGPQRPHARVHAADQAQDTRPLAECHSGWLLWGDTPLPEDRGGHGRSDSQGGRRGHHVANEDHADRQRLLRTRTIASDPVAFARTAGS